MTDHDLETPFKTKLETKDYSLYYGKFKALNEISIKIPEKQVTALIGPSGCGKSTLLYVISGISRPDSGKVQVGDWDITLFTEAELNFLRDSLNGAVLMPELAYQPSLILMIEDSGRLDGYGDKWQVDVPALVSKVKALSEFECYALSKSIDQWWIEQ